MMIGTDMDKSIQTPIGSYDINILCASCDSSIGIYDRYASDFIKKSTLTPHPSGLGWLIDNVNQHKLKMFCITYLWRASITTRKEYKGVSLGYVHEDQIRQMILKNDSGSVHDYTVSIQRFSNDDGKYGGILLPAKTKVAGLTCYEGYLPKGYKFWVKVDSRNEDSVSKLSVGYKEQLFVGNRGDFHGSKEEAIMARAAKRSK